MCAAIQKYLNDVVNFKTTFAFADSLFNLEPLRILLSFRHNIFALTVDASLMKSASLLHFYFT
jgi:hypothetical protein